MNIFKPKRGIGIYYILGNILLINITLVLITVIINAYFVSYILISLLKFSFVIFNLYLIYYALLDITLKFQMDDNFLYILSFWGLRKIKLPFSLIEGYKFEENKINGTKLSGIAKNSFAFGKSVIRKIGTTKMFVTSNKHIIYLKTEDINYAISPENYNEFEAVLSKKNINLSEWEHHTNKVSALYKDKRFIIPLILVSIVILLITIIPFILYIDRKLPSIMPLNFDANFIPVEKGTGKQFAINQAIYGVLNMIILFCMYYASYFHAKYDKKSASRYIFASLGIALVFFILQLRILYYFVFLPHVCIP